MLYIVVLIFVAACAYTGYGILQKDTRYQEYAEAKGIKAFAISVGLAVALGALHYLVWVQTLLTSKKNDANQSNRDNNKM